MLVTTCIPCQHGHHEECGVGMHAAPPGMIGGTQCGCEGECVERAAGTRPAPAEPSTDETGREGECPDASEPKVAG